MTNITSNPGILTQASHQWATRPSDERFTSLPAMKLHFDAIKDQSAEKVVPSRRIHALPTADNKGLQITGPNGVPYDPTHWSFGQVAQLAHAPGAYLRTLPSPIAADCINYGLQYRRNIEDVGVLLQRAPDANTLRAATGPRYGRIWNSDIVNYLVQRFGNGVDGPWKVPGEFGKDVAITKDNTTLYASDRDMFVFLADEKNRIEIPNRRNGQPGQLARGFFMWNSEVGDKTFGLATFLFDFVCMNRIVWGATEFAEIRIRHTVSAPDKYLDEMRPALESYANGKASNVVAAIEDARKNRIDDVGDFLANRFGKNLVQPLQLIHKSEEGRPIETRWDAVTAATAYARSIPNTDNRVEFERIAGGLLEAA